MMSSAGQSGTESAAAEHAKAYPPPEESAASAVATADLYDEADADRLASGRSRRAAAI